MKKLTIISLLLLALVLTGCNLPGYQEATDESGDSMATEIAKILTGTPVEIVETATQAEMTEPTSTATIEVTEPTQEDTATEEVVETATEEVVETATPAPTETPTASPTPTLADTDPALTLGDPDWVDTMDNGDNWPTGYDPFTSVDFDDGYMKLTADTDMYGWRLSWPTLEDFYLEAKIQSVSCEDYDSFGVMFRVPDTHENDQGYLFAITCEGQYSLYIWDDPSMPYLISWTGSDAINKGENAVNTLGIMAKDATLTFYINGQKVDEITDNSYLKGGFGIFVGGSNAEEPTIWVDQIRYWKID